MALKKKFVYYIFGERNDERSIFLKRQRVVPIQNKLIIFCTILGCSQDLMMITRHYPVSSAINTYSNCKKHAILTN